MGGKEFKKMKKSAKMEKIAAKKQHKETNKEVDNTVPIAQNSKKIKKQKIIHKKDQKVENIIQDNKQTINVQTEKPQKITKSDKNGKINDSLKATNNSKKREQQVNQLKSKKNQANNQKEHIQQKQQQQQSPADNTNNETQTLPQAPPMNLSNFSGEVFTDLVGLSKPTKEALKKLKYFNLTKIQAKILPTLLASKDIQVSAPTNSGKTLAVILAAVEQLTRDFQQSHGTGAIIIVPNNEVALKTFNEAKAIVQFHQLTLGLLLGGQSKEQQAIRLESGVNIIIATPMRLLYHLSKTEGFKVSNLRSLFILKAEAIIEQQLNEKLIKITSFLPEQKQIAVFTETHNKQVKELFKAINNNNNNGTIITEQSIKDTHNATQNDKSSSKVIEGSFEHGYAIIDGDKKLRLLYTFLEKQKKDKKIIVFVSSCNATQFLADVFNNLELSVQCLHTRQTQKDRQTILAAYQSASSSILLVSEAVYKGHNIPHADWFIQYDPPQDAHHYIQIAQQICSTDTSSSAASPGKAIIFLLPEESKFVKLLADLNLSSTEFSFPQHKLASIQEQVDNLVERNYFFNKSATEAFRAYLQNYSQHSLKDIFNISSFDVLKVCRSFGFVMPPRINNLGVKLVNKQLEQKVLAAQTQAAKQQ